GGYQGSTRLHPVVRKARSAGRIHGWSKAYPGRSSGAERRRNDCHNRQAGAVRGLCHSAQTSAAEDCPS
ncbi:MAG: hypothetical protein WAO55_12080, partial [Candidatus Manganitrophaceae bacterium]